MIIYKRINIIVIFVRFTGRSKLEKRVYHSSVRAHIRCNILWIFLFRRATTLG